MVYLIAGLLIVIFYILYNVQNSKNCCLFYTTFDDENYFKVVSRLEANGIRYKVRSPMDARQHERALNLNKQSDIYVRKEDEHKAVGVLRDLN